MRTEKIRRLENEGVWNKEELNKHAFLIRKVMPDSFLPRLLETALGHEMSLIAAM